METIRNDDEPIGRTLEELCAPQYHGYFTKKGDLPEIDLPTYTADKDGVDCFIYWRYMKHRNGYGFRTEVFIPSMKVIFTVPDYLDHRGGIARNREYMFRTRPAEKIEYEQLEGSEKYGRIKHIKAIRIQQDFLDLLVKHNTITLSQEEFLLMSSKRRFVVMNTSFPSIQPEYEVG